MSERVFRQEFFTIKRFLPKERPTAKRKRHLRPDPKSPMVIYLAIKSPGGEAGI
jgi:hypothetical protein